MLRILITADTVPTVGQAGGPGWPRSTLCTVLEPDARVILCPPPRGSSTSSHPEICARPACAPEDALPRVPVVPRLWDCSESFDPTQPLPNSSRRPGRRLQNFRAAAQDRYHLVSEAFPPRRLLASFWCPHCTIFLSFLSPTVSVNPSGEDLASLKPQHLAMCLAFNR